MSPQEIVFVVDGKPQGKQRPRLGKGGCVYTPRARTDIISERKCPGELETPGAWQLETRSRCVLIVSPSQ